jgi:hypothetical protein
MAKKPVLHPYSDCQAFERLMLLLATLVQYPGVGYNEEHPPSARTGHPHDALQEVQTLIKQVAASSGVEWPAGYPATSTLRKDLETLRHYGILDRRMYRWGYYLGTGVMKPEELQAALGALESYAKYQGHPLMRKIYQSISKRLRGFHSQSPAQFFYPVRQLFNRAVIQTDPEVMIEQGDYQDTLFHQLETVEQAIVDGQAIEISRGQDLYNRGRVGPIQVWPLQLIYYDIAWYLVYESCHNAHLAVGRLNRFKDYCKLLPSQIRSIETQQQSLQNAHQLIENGWGLNLGEPQEQVAELAGTLPLENVQIKFFAPVASFIWEGTCRHSKQKLTVGPKDSTGKPTVVNYSIELPPRSLKEFGWWIWRYGACAQILSPPALIEQHTQATRKLAALYLS